MSDDTCASVRERLKCLFSGHDYRAVYAKDLEPNAARKIDPETGEENRIAGCTTVRECSRCGKSLDFASSIEVVDMLNIPTEWGETGHGGDAGDE